MNAHTIITERTSVNMTSKGQVLIPKAIRDRMGLVPGQRVDVGINDRGEAVVLPPGMETPAERRARITAALESVSGTADFGFDSTDDYMAFIRPHLKEL